MLFTDIPTLKIDIFIGEKYAASKDGDAESGQNIVIPS
jgi:hypothetical protein